MLCIFMILNIIEKKIKNMHFYKTIIKTNHYDVVCQRNAKHLHSVFRIKLVWLSVCSSRRRSTNERCLTWLLKMMEQRLFTMNGERNLKFLPLKTWFQTVCKDFTSTQEKVNSDNFVILKGWLNKLQQMVIWILKKRWFFPSTTHYCAEVLETPKSAETGSNRMFTLTASVLFGCFFVTGCIWVPID